MAGFIRIGAQVMRTQGPKVIKYLAGQGVAAVPKIIKPGADFARGALKGGPKYIAVGEGTGVTTATVTASVRAGMQARYIARETGKAVIFKGPATAVNGVKFLVRTAVKDVTWPYDVAYIGYRAGQITRVAGSRTSLVERGLDVIFRTTNKYLTKVGLEPTYRGLGGVGVRYIAYGVAAKGIDLITGRIDELHTTARKYLDQAREATVVSGPADGDRKYIPVAPASPATGPVPVVVGGVGSGNPVVNPPPSPTIQSRSRQYIPTGGR